MGDTNDESVHITSLGERIYAISDEKGRMEVLEGPGEAIGDILLIRASSGEPYAMFDTFAEGRPEGWLAIVVVAPGVDDPPMMEPS